MRETHWKQYATHLFETGKYAPAEIVSEVSKKFPTINVSTIKYYVQHSRGFTCPMCSSMILGVEKTIYNTDFIARTRSCLCGYKWSTVEVDLDIFEKLAGVSV